MVRTLDAAEGRIMIGSSTELNNEVPLENYLALRRAVLEHPYSTPGPQIGPPDPWGRHQREPAYERR